MLVPDASAPLTADTLLGGRYRLVRPVANGGMAAVWEGHDEILARSVAVKVLHPHLAADRRFQERFRREAIAAARLSHPNVVATYDAGTANNGTAYIVMELVRGTNLREYLARQGRLSPRLAVGISIQIADALRHAHGAGLIHRDIKPANVLLCRSDADHIPQVKVTDFGIAKAAEGMELDLTGTGMVIGTPKYLSPEQVEGREPDARADLYSLGVVLFEMLAGEPPFAGPTDIATALARIHQPAPRIADRLQGVPPDLDRLVMALLATEPANRPPSAAAVRQALVAMDTTTSPYPPASARAQGYPGVTHAAPGYPGVTQTAPNPTGYPSGMQTAPTGTWRPPRPTAAPTTVWHRGATPSDRTAVVVPAGGQPTRRDRGPAGPQGSSGLRPPVPAPGRSRRSPWPGRVIVALVAATAVVAAVAIFGRGPSPAGSPAAIKGGSTSAATPVVIRTVSVFHLERDADNAATVGYTHDGNPATVWNTDVYYGPNFAGLRHGLGLAITLSGSHRLHQLVVQSPTHGWSAEVFVAQSVQAQASLTPWGQPVATKQGIQGSATFDLGGKQGGAILLWITDLGPAHTAGVAELSVS